MTSWRLGEDFTCGPTSWNCCRRDCSASTVAADATSSSFHSGVVVIVVINFVVIFARTHPFNGLFSGTTRVSRYQKGKTHLDFTEARDSEWQWHQLGYMQVCTSLQTDNHASIPPLRFLQSGCPSCRPANSVKALKAKRSREILIE